MTNANEHGPVRIADLYERGLRIDSWTMQASEVWCVLGGNGSGKGRLSALLAGEWTCGGGSVSGLPRSAAIVSFETQQQVYEAELARDDSDFINGVDPGSTALGVILHQGATRADAERWAARLEATDLLGRYYRQLSSGEVRKVLLVAALCSAPELLIVDEPFEGLDSAARQSLHRSFGALVKAGQRVLLLCGQVGDVGPWVTHVALLRAGQLLCTGPAAQVLGQADIQQILHLTQPRARSLPAALEAPPALPSPLIALRRCSVRYGNVVQFAPFDWTLQAGQHTSIVGPNGAGKSTVLQLICGDHPQCYANHIELFGYRRGNGESIWDIKRHIGMVSPSLHRDYRASGNALAVVASGFFDTIGLYTRPAPRQLSASRHLLALFGLESAATTDFRALSFGQQRMVLIARALAKQPPLLILDEPTQGLDDLNRHLVLACVQQLSGLRRTTLLFVSHREDEHLPLFQHRLRFLPVASAGADGSVTRFEVRVEPYSNPES